MATPKNPGTSKFAEVQRQLQTTAKYAPKLQRANDLIASLSPEHL